MGFLDKILNRQKTEVNQELPAEAESDNSGAVRGVERKESSELRKKARRLFAAGALFAASMSGASFTGNEAQAGETDNKPGVHDMNQTENTGQERKQELLEKVMQRIRQQVSVKRDNSSSSDYSQRRTNEILKLRNAALIYFLANPEKATTKLMDQNTVLISFEYPHPASGIMQSFDQMYTIE